MIFESIRLKNFRQYKNEIKFDFSQPENGKKNISILIAANGVGKTTLLQAFRYCFYGKSANYLNLPSRSELVNNTLVDDLKDLDEVQMFVEVIFKHKGIKYLAIRESSFFKSKGLLKDNDKEKFSLTESTDNDGYKAFDSEAKANDKIRSILPEGLSQVFMFDGERMERNISDSKFSLELKESILGILDIKKYDKLIEIIGHPGKATSLLGLLTSKKRADTEEDRKTKSKYEDLLEKKEYFLQEIQYLNDALSELSRKITMNQEQQIKHAENKERAIEKIRKEEEIDRNKILISEESRKYIKNSKQALIYKLLIDNKKRYDNYIHKGKKHENFYAYLHVDTLNDVQEKKICICGRPISEHTEEYKRLEALKENALPIEASQHLNLIDQKFKQCAGYSDHMSNLKQIKSKITEIINVNKKLSDEVHILIQEIHKVEKILGITNQTEIDELISLKESKLKELGESESKLKLIDSSIKSLEKKIAAIDNGNVYNQKVNSVIDIVQDIKHKLEETKNKLDLEAREVLAEKFNDLLSKTIHGKYDVRINSKYQISIMDLGNNKDVTNSLNTGHNVVISLTFISALIQTAKQLSNKMDKDEKYGVLMDAALSNLDEVHIDRLCRNTLNDLDQLVFLSFKRQLRDEMYMGIKDNIGVAYQIKKHEKGDVYKNILNLDSLSDYIHKIEEE